MQQQTEILKEIAIVRKLAGLHASEPVVQNEMGWTSRVHLVNGGQFCFKFPRSKAARQEYAHELAGLRMLQGFRWAVQLPEIRWVHPRNAYFGYAGIQGSALDQSSGWEPRAVGARLGGFLKQLHTRDLSGLPSISIEDEIKQFQSQYRLGREVLQQHLSRAQQTQLRSLVHQELPSALVRLGSEPALCHGDLGYWNIVAKPDGEVGVIDFGDIGYYDRSKDFIGMQDSQVLESALQEYGDRLRLRQKIAVRQKMLPILELPHYIGKRDEAAIARTLARVAVVVSSC